MPLIDENMAEQACLDWFEELGYLRVFGPDIAPGGSNQERASYKQIVLQDRLLGALRRINPTILQILSWRVLPVWCITETLQASCRRIGGSIAGLLMGCQWKCSGKVRPWETGCV